MDNKEDFNPYDTSKVNEYNPTKNIQLEEGSISTPEDNNDINSSNGITSDTPEEHPEDTKIDEKPTLSTPAFMKTTPISTETSQSSSSETESKNQEKTVEKKDIEETEIKKETGNTFDDEENIKWKKVSAEEASKKPKTKPKILNKRFLLSLLVFAFLIIFIVAYLSPQDKKKKEDATKPTVQNVARTDYSSIAKKRPEENTSYDSSYDSDDNTHYSEENRKSSNNKNEDVEIPPVIKDDKKAPYTNDNINYNTGTGNGSNNGGSTIQIPDTRNDSLQGKSIRGIKGLSSTQSSYSTDYQQTVAQNTQNNYSTSNLGLPSKQDFMNNMMNPYTQAAMNNNDYAIQNDRSGKDKFYNNGRNSENVGNGQFLPLNSIWQGTIFEATLTSEINTDLPGEITARVSKNIYSSQDGQYLLIPQNSVLFGTYNSSISYSQSRVQVAWNKLIRPDGYEVQLGNMTGTDEKGASGLKGFVNDHPLSYLKAIGLMSVFSIINSEFDNMVSSTQESNNATSPYVQNILANTQNVTVTLGEKLIDRAMNVQPTIKIKAGTKINIVANQNLMLPPCENIPVTQQYRKYK